MYRIFLFLLNLLIAEFLVAETALIGGHFNKPHSQTVTIKYYSSSLNFIEGRSTIIEHNLDDKNNFMFEIETENPIKFQLLNGEKWLLINKYAAPGDSVWFDFNDSSTTISGNSEHCINFMFEWENRFFIEPTIKKEVNSSHNDYDAQKFANYWNKRKNDQLEYFKLYFKNKSVPIKFQQFIEAEVNYSYAIAILQYSWRNKSANFVLKDTGYLKFLQNVLIDNHAALNYESYLFFLKELPNNIFMSKLEDDKINNPNSSYVLKNKEHFMDSIAKQYFTGKAYDLSLYQILYQQIKSIGRSKGQPYFDYLFLKADTLLTQYRYNFHDSFYFVRLKTKLREYASENIKAHNFVLKNIEGKEVRLSDFKGKVVYLDFWATNCAPCVAEIQHANKLKEKFKGKDVVFLYVSFDNSPEKLKSFIYLKSFQGIHLYDTKGFASEISEKYEINSIPRYFLIDKNGFIINRDAPRPSLNPESLIENALN